MRLSVVTTLYQSAPYIEEFHRRVSDAASRITDEYEIVMVDDGSPDNALEIGLALVERDPRLQIVELSRNFGHHKAMMTGMEQAKGDLVFLIDVDLEEPPELLERFYGELEHGGWDVVFGYQEERKGGVIERIGGQIAWVLINKLYSANIPRNHCTVRLMQQQYVKSLLLHRESNTVIGGLWVITGYKQFGIPIKKGNRPETSYTISRRLVTMLNGITSFSTAPLRFMFFVGTIISSLSFAFGIYVIFRKLLFNAAAGWASVMASIWFLGGIMIFCMGTIGLYISRVFIETKNRPYTIVRRIYAQKENVEGSTEPVAFAKEIP